jgi:hypothetical protein
MGMAQGIRVARGKTSDISDVISDRCDRMYMVCLLYPDDKGGAGAGSYGVATNQQGTEDRLLAPCVASTHESGIDSRATSV